MQLSILKNDVYIFLIQTKTFIRDDKFLIYMKEFFNYNVIKSLDMEFMKFINLMDNWWHHYATINDYHTPVL